MWQSIWSGIQQSYDRWANTLTSCNKVWWWTERQTSIEASMRMSMHPWCLPKPKLTPIKWILIPKSKVKLRPSENIYQILYTMYKNHFIPLYSEVFWQLEGIITLTLHFSCVIFAWSKIHCGVQNYRHMYHSQILMYLCIFRYWKRWWKRSTTTEMGRSP